MEEKLCYCSSEDGIVCEHCRKEMMDTLNFPKIVETWSIDKLREELTEKKEELDINMMDYDGRVHWQTLACGRLGQYREEEFLEWLGHTHEEVLEWKEDCSIYDVVYEEFEKLESDINAFCVANGIDLGEYVITIGYDDNDGDICAFLMYPPYEEELSGLTYDEYDIRFALKDLYGCTIGEVIDIADNHYQVAGVEYLVYDHTLDEEEIENIKDRMIEFDTQAHELDANGDVYYAYKVL